MGYMDGLIPLPRRNANEFLGVTPDGSMLVFGGTGLDANSTTTSTEPVDLAAIAARFGQFHVASLQLSSESTTIGTAVGRLEASNDGDRKAGFTALSSGATSAGASIVVNVNIKGVRFLRAAIGTAEGAAETCGLYAVCTKAPS